LGEKVTTHDEELGLGEKTEIPATPYLKKKMIKYNYHQD
jgi:hypothetical protein